MNIIKNKIFLFLLGRFPKVEFEHQRVLVIFLRFLICNWIPKLFFSNFTFYKETHLQKSASMVHFSSIYYKEITRLLTLPLFNHGLFFFFFFLESHFFDFIYSFITEANIPKPQSLVCLAFQTLCIYYTPPHRTYSFIWILMLGFMFLRLIPVVTCSW